MGGQNVQVGRAQGDETKAEGRYGGYGIRKRVSTGAPDPANVGEGKAIAHIEEHVSHNQDHIVLNH